MRRQNQARCPGRQRSSIWWLGVWPEGSGVTHKDWAEGGAAEKGGQGMGFQGEREADPRKKADEEEPRKNPG